MQTLVTCGAGFIGSHLVDLLVENGHEVVVLDNLSLGRMENLVAAQSWGKLIVVDDDIRTVDLRVSVSLCAGAWFTSSPRIGWGKPRLVG